MEAEQQEPLFVAGRFLQPGANLGAGPVPFPALGGPHAGVADQHRDALAVAEPPAELQPRARDLEGCPRVAVRERPTHVDPGPDLGLEQAVLVGESQGRLEAAETLVRAAHADEGRAAGDEHVRHEVDAVEVLRDRQGAVRGGHGGREVDLAEHLEAGQLAEQGGIPTVLTEVGELGGGRLDERERGVQAVAPEQRVGQAPADPCCAASVAHGPEQLDGLRQVALGLLVESRGGCRRAGTFQQDRSVVRFAGHLDRVTVEPQRLLLRSQRDRPVPGRPQRDPRLCGERLGLRALDSVAVGGQVVVRKRPGQLLVHERLEMAGRREVAGLAVAPRERGVGDFANERLDERELAALHGSRVQVAGNELPANQRQQAALHVAGVERRDGGQAVHREGMAQHRGCLQERPVGRFQAIEACRDQRVQRLRHGQVGQVAHRPVDPVGCLQGTLGHQHPDDLHGVQGNPVGARDDPCRGRGGQAGHEAREERAHGLGRERLQREAGEVALAGAPVRPGLQQLRASERDHVDRDAAAPFRQVVDEGEQAAVRPLEVLEDHHDRVVRGEPLEERAPRGEQAVLPAGRRVGYAEQGEQRRLDPATLLLVRDPAGGGFRDPGACRRLVVRLGEPGPLADHLAERPERDPAAVRGRAPVVPVDGLDEAVDVLEELPGEPALADAALAGHGDEPYAPVPGGRVVEVLEKPQLVISPHEGRLDRFGPPPAAALGHHAKGAPGRDRRGLALEELVAGLRECDRPGGRVHRRLSDEHDVGRRGTLQPAGGVDHVPGDHALAHRPDGHRCLAGHDTNAGVDHRAESADAADDLQGGPHGALGVVLVAGRRAPDRHHGVADELLDRAAVALDDPAGKVEIARQQVADLLRVPRLGDRREAHEVGEEDRDDPPLCHGWRRRGTRAGRGRRRESGRRRPGEARPALTAEARRRRVRRAAGRTGGRERRPALEAELAARVVVCAAARTDHRNHPP